MIDRIIAKNGTPIRLTDERWTHITEEHGELTGLRSTVLETVRILIVSCSEEMENY